MSTQITRAHVQQYKSRVEMLLQQKPSYFEMAVGTDSYEGKAATVVEQVGAVEAIEKTARHADTAIVDIPHDRPWVFPRDFPFAAFIDREDKLRMLADFQAPYADVLAAAIQRKKDDLIIAAATANMMTGENGSTAQAFDTTNHRIAAGSSGLTVTKLIQAAEILQNSENDPDEPRYCAISPRQLRNLLTETQVTSADYNTVRALAEGKVDTYMGFKFIRTNRLPLVGSDRGCLAWVKSGLHLGTWAGLNTRIDERPDKAYLTQVFVSISMGATRTQGSTTQSNTKVVQILCTP